MRTVTGKVYSIKLVLPSWDGVRYLLVQLAEGYQPEYVVDRTGSFAANGAEMDFPQVWDWLARQDDSVTVTLYSDTQRPDVMSRAEFCIL